MIQLYDYQKDFIFKIEEKLKLFDRVCAQLATGGGKTIVFTEMAKRYNGQVLILVDSEELVYQTARNFKNAGTFEAKNKFLPSENVVIAMADTVWSRLKKTPDLISRFDLLIVDECHVWKFNKIFDFLKPTCKILGFTATPVRLKRIKYFKCEYCGTEKDYQTECCGSETSEWSKEETMSQVYQDIVCGVDIQFLIDNDFLVDEESYQIELENNNFKTDSSGEFTNASINSALENEKYQIDILENYNEFCQGKKTMIFTPNTKINKLIYDLFIENGFENIKFYDSVNSTSKERKPIVEWFRNTENSILLNVSCFTKGFDVKDVEAIILARPTASLSLFIQIAGRGSRTTDENQIYKDRFIFIDGGGNIERHGLWSSPRNWERIFFKGIKPPKAVNEQLETTKECFECGAINSKNDRYCEECGVDMFPEDEDLQKDDDEDLIVRNKVLAKNSKPLYPNANKIINFTIRKKEDMFFALRILNNQIFDLFVRNKVTKEQFEKNLNGGLQRILKQHLNKNYYLIINSPLRSEAKRTLKKQQELLITKLKKYYEIQ